MERPQNNGLVELVDEKPSLDNSSWNCMDFWLFSGKEEDKSWVLPMPVFLLPNPETALIRVYALDTPGQWQKEVNSLFN